ncbi:hypothetical protein Poli38472_011753 [Pythium oligandrum]|uniref:Uncharacterized protein n=1 Tax=Pythium oligandrum TaxID=41045 RepID=A0A8K1C817_PYTOL|nr:hypothetical protein Poli38472_011753 [Pythium oligandrum]|eukprot:TMW58165.1 hypothetical protein Poli38472_011753 [Pythium oligandrum]
MVWRRSLRNNAPLQRSVRNQVTALMIQVCMTYVYPLYFFAFTSLPPFGQSAFSFMLPLIKLCLKNGPHRSLRALDDIKPVFVVLNVDVFGSFYVASSLQASQSTLNTVLILAVGIAQIAVAIYDIRAVMREIGSLVRWDHFEGSLFDLCLVSAASEKSGPSVITASRTSTLQLR